MLMKPEIPGELGRTSLVSKAGQLFYQGPRRTAACFRDGQIEISEVDFQAIISFAIQLCRWRCRYGFWGYPAPV